MSQGKDALRPLEYWGGLIEPKGGQESVTDAPIHEVYVRNSTVRCPFRKGVLVIIRHLTERHFLYMHSRAGWTAAWTLYQSLKRVAGLSGPP